MSNNYLVEILEKNRNLLSLDFHKHLEFIIDRINSNSEKINSVDQVIAMGDINIGTPDHPLNVSIKTLKPLLNYLQNNIFTSYKHNNVDTYLKTINNSNFVYGQPEITQKEKDYINRFVKKLNLEKIESNKLASFSQFLDNIVIPFINQVRAKCSDKQGHMNPLTNFSQCDSKIQTNINELVRKIEDEKQGNPMFIVPPESSLNIPIKTENTYLTSKSNKSISGAQNIIDFVSKELEEKKKEELASSSKSNSIEKYLKDNDPTLAYDKSATVDITSPKALGIGDPYFDNQVAKDATYYSSNYKSMTKKTQVVIADVYNGTSGTYPYAITNHKVEFSENLIVSAESDVQLEFMNLHEIHGNSTVATRKSLEHYHGFILKINEISKYFNSVSNMGDLVGTFYIPNDTFGFQDNNEPNIVDGGVISNVGVNGGGTKTLITLPDNSLHSERDDYYNNYYLKITSGNAQGQIGQIEDYAGSTRVATLKIRFDPAPSADDSFEILESPHSDRTLNSLVFKLKNSFICTMKPEKIQSFTITLSALEHGTTTPVPLYIGSADGRLQLGLHIKER